ncbi:MAG: UDP-N-acetylmuramoyl-L-alanine--D-glutamate ligase [Xanthomonadales bacterium]|nr:UDP-N-acetylmuramoyl-L-alanine--D-glutamate ligase [Xanthomonadales bacterium]
MAAEAMNSGVPFEGRIAILGSGREGLAVYEYIKAQGTADTLEILTEGLSGREREAELQASGALLIGPFEQASLETYDVLVRSPGVSIYRDCLKDAAAAGVRITTPSSIWFAAHPSAHTIVITGTKGKSTTASLLAHMLQRQGQKVRLAGNIGTPLIACDEPDIDWWVIELSRFQLADLEARPTLGVLLNLSTDHLDWHGGEGRYRADKLRLAELAERGVVANGDDLLLREALGGRAGVQWFSQRAASDVTMPDALPGKHNRSNVAACLAVVEWLKLDRDAALAALSSFRGLPHRLQRLGEVDGVTFINDSISSAPVATVAALQALEGEEVILLAGGYDRGIDWAPYAALLAEHAPIAVFTMPDNGPHIARALHDAGVAPRLGILKVEDLASAVQVAKDIAPRGAVILLSPGAPSFPYFRDYEDRGAQFASLSFGQFRPQ